MDLRYYRVYRRGNDFDSEQIKVYLDTMSKFYHYIFNNFLFAARALDCYVEAGCVSEMYIFHRLVDTIA